MKNFDECGKPLYRNNKTLRPSRRSVLQREGCCLAYADSFALAYMSADFSPVAVLM